MIPPTLIPINQRSQTRRRALLVEPALAERLGEQDDVGEAALIGDGDLSQRPPAAAVLR